jgi:transposase
MAPPLDGTMTAPTSKKKLAPPDTPANIQGRIRRLHVAIQSNAQFELEQHLKEKFGEERAKLEKQGDKKGLAKLELEVKKEKSSTYSTLLHVQQKLHASTLKQLEARLKKCTPKEKNSKSSSSPNKQVTSSRKPARAKKKVSKRTKKPSSTAGSILNGSGGAMGRSEGLTEGARQSARAAKKKPLSKTLSSLLDSMGDDEP